MKNVFIIWEYDDGIVPEKSLVSVCDSIEIAQKEQRKLKQGTPEYTYEIEPKELKTK